MNSKLRSSIVGLIICTLLLGNLVTVVIAQPPTDSYNGKSAATDEIQPTTSEQIKSEVVANEFNERRMTDNKIKAADAFLVENGFSAKTEPENAFG
jgi:hypothetical protein